MQKTITVEHPDAHQATEAAYETARAEAGIPEDAELVRSENESGVATKWVFKFGPEDVPPAEPAAPAEPAKPRK